MSTKRSRAHQHLVVMQQAHKQVIKLIAFPKSQAKSTSAKLSLAYAAVVIYHMYGWNHYKQAKGLPVKWRRTKGHVTLSKDEPEVGEADG